MTALAWIVVIVVAAVLVERVVLWWSPIPTGVLPAPMPWSYRVHLTLDLLLFGPILVGRFLPIPILMLLYRGLGARIGQGSYTAGVICDPSLTTIGDHSLLGIDSVVASHQIVGGVVTHAPVVIGSGVTVGGGAGILQGVVIGDGAVIGPNAVVVPWTEIGPGELWGGNPARKRGMA